MIWNASLVWARIDQLARVAAGRTLPSANWRHAKDEDFPEALVAFEEVGLLRLTTWKTPPRPVIRCPRCAHSAWRLIVKDRAWVCRWCHGGGKPSPLVGTAGGPNTGMTRTEILLGDYACGLRIGLTGMAMLRRRRFLLRRMRDRHLLQGRKPLDLLLLAVAGPMLAPNPTWDRRWQDKTRKTRLGTLGPVFHRLAPQVLPAAVDQLLHPAAYLLRFGGLG